MRKALLLVLLCPLLCYGKIYRWQDSEGNTYFADTPHKGAKQVVLPKVQEYSPLKQQQLNQDENKPADVSPRSYKSIVISQPQAGSTVRNNQGFVAVIIHVEPSLVDGDKFQLSLNGKKIGEAQATPSFAIKGINRGTHSIVVQVIDRDGAVVGESEPRVFYMHRARVGMVPPKKPSSSPSETTSP